jgi:hypothetical protein
VESDTSVKDRKGIYYYPFPANRRVRMYVRAEGDDVAFRMDNSDDPKMWAEHGWRPYAAIEQAVKIYNGKGFDPRQAYDVTIARALLKEHGEG